MSTYQQISVFYDGRSGFLGRTSRVLKRLDHRHNLLWLNTAMRKFEPRIYDRTESELSTGVHAQMPDQSWADGPDAIRAACSAIGLGPFVMITQLPGADRSSTSGIACWSGRTGASQLRSELIQLGDGTAPGTRKRR